MNEIIEELQQKQIEELFAEAEKADDIEMKKRYIDLATTLTEAKRKQYESYIEWERFNAETELKKSQAKTETRLEIGKIIASFIASAGLAGLSIAQAKGIGFFDVGAKSAIDGLKKVFNKII